MSARNAAIARPKADQVDPTHQARALRHEAGPGLRSSPRPADMIEDAQRPTPRAEPADTYLVDSGGEISADPADHPVTDQPKRGRAALVGIIGLGVIALIGIAVFSI
ncbi:MAG: hypothetical protein AAFQ79_13245 [Pseudomonadota bacterium]